MTLHLMSKSLMYDLPGLAYGFTGNNNLDSAIEFRTMIESMCVHYTRLYHRVINGKRLNADAIDQVRESIGNYTWNAPLCTPIQFEYRVQLEGEEPSLNVLLFTSKPDENSIIIPQKGSDLENKIVRHVVEKEMRFHGFLDR